MPYTDAGKNLMLDALARGVAPPAAGIDAISLHDDVPNASGSNEIEGGEYARQAIAWNAAASGAIDDSTNGAAFKVPGSTAVKYIGFWADNGGEDEAFVAFAQVDEETFNNAGTYTVTDGDLNLALTS